MKLQSLELALTAALSLTALTAHSAALKSGDQLTISSGIYDSAYGSFVVGGSYLGFDLAGDGSIGSNDKIVLDQGTAGIIIGMVQGTDLNTITQPYPFLGVDTQEYTTSPITGSTETGLDFSGLSWAWNIDVSFGSGAWGVGYTDGIANFAWDGIYGHSYTIDYHAAFPAVLADYEGRKVSYHFEGIVVSAVPVPAAVWLFGSGVLGLIGVARRKKHKA